MQSDIESNSNSSNSSDEDEDMSREGREVERLVSNTTGRGKDRERRVEHLRRKIAEREFASRKRLVCVGTSVFLVVFAVLIVLYVGKYIGVSLSRKRTQTQGNMWTEAGEVHHCRSAWKKLARLELLEEDAVARRSFLQAAKVQNEIERLKALCSDYAGPESDLVEDYSDDAEGLEEQVHAKHSKGEGRTNRERKGRDPASIEKETPSKSAEAVAAQ
eukprot:INCI3732.1.p1 GENE.INCI3732.1~~INCI3732.1.p1  ORF type:complete len:217 (+),score=48.34 INCI3732.1:91-741(+)